MVFPWTRVREGGIRISDKMCEKPSSGNCSMNLSTHPFNDWGGEEIVLPWLEAHTLDLLVGSQQCTPGFWWFCPCLSFSVLVSLSLSLLSFLFLSSKDISFIINKRFSDTRFGLFVLDFIQEICWKESLPQYSRMLKKIPSLIAECNTMFLFYLLSLGEWTNWVQTCSRPSWHWFLKVH